MEQTSELSAVTVVQSLLQMYGFCEVKVEPAYEGSVFPPVLARRKRLALRLSTREDERFMNVRVANEGIHADLPFRDQLVPCFIPSSAIRECKGGGINTTHALPDSAAEDAEDDYEDGGWGIVDDGDDSLVDEPLAVQLTRDEDKQATFMMLMEANEKVDVIVDPQHEGVHVAQLQKMSDLVAIPLRFSNGQQTGWAVCHEGIKLDGHFAGKPCRGLIEWSAVTRLESADEVRDGSAAAKNELPAPLTFSARTMAAGYNPSRATPND